MIVLAVYLQPEVQSPGSNMNMMELLSKTNNSDTLYSHSLKTLVLTFGPDISSRLHALHHDGAHECKVEHACLLP